jgi:hypothetical protein
MEVIPQQLLQIKHVQLVPNALQDPQHPQLALRTNINLYKNKELVRVALLDISVQILQLLLIVHQIITAQVVLVQRLHVLKAPIQLELMLNLKEIV